MACTSTLRPPLHLAAFAGECLTAERARKRVRKIRVAERGIVVGRKVGGRRGLPTASNANVKTGE